MRGSWPAMLIDGPGRGRVDERDAQSIEATLIERLHAIVQTQREISLLELDPDAITDAIVERTQWLAGADGAVVQWFDGGDTVYGHVAGVAAGHEGLRLRPGASLAGIAARTGETLYAADTDADPRVDREQCRRVGIRSLICSPLHHEGEAIGALAVMARDASAFDDLAVETTRLMAQFVSAVTRNARELEARRRLVEELQESESRFRGAFHSSSIGMCLNGLDGRFLQVNERIAEMLGYRPEELLALRSTDVIAREDVARVARLGEQLVRRRREPHELEVEVTRSDGSRVRARLGISLVRDRDGLPVHFVTHVEDLTRQHALEAQLRQAQKMEAVGRLAGGIAHDFNNLLTAIGGYSEFLVSGLEDPRLRRQANEIRKAAARAAALTGQLLAFSRQQVLQPRVLDLNAVVSDMEMMLRRLIGEDVELQTMLDSALGPVKADPTQIEQVIVNLAVNARDAMPGGGSMTIQTANVVTDRGDCVELRLTDTGVGMSEDERHQLFDPFFTTKEGGTGLGLATVYGIVEQSGATIDVESAPGMGSSFRILIPRVDASAEPADTAPADGTPAGGHETILLVEDEAVVRRLVGEILEVNGYTVLEAADGPSALELLRRHTGDVGLLVTDVVMPGMSGREVAQAVTAMRPRTHVLYTSGYTDSAIGHHGVLEPGTAFLQKPFSADDLTRKVRSLLDAA